MHTADGQQHLTQTENKREYIMAKQTAAEETQGIEYEAADGFSFNMSEEKASSGFPLIPNGNHSAVIEALEYKISQNSGNPMWSIKWAFEEPELASKNRKINSFVVFSPEQRGRAKMFLKRVAPELSELEDFNPKKVADEALLVGKRATLKINTQKGQDGEDRSNVADVLAASAGGTSGSFSL